MPPSYYFSDPQESNLLTSLYIADDDNNNLVDGTPFSHAIRQAFARHNLLQATLLDDDSYDVSANSLGKVTGGDFYFHAGSFWANNLRQRGVVDLGNIGDVALASVTIPATGYTRFGVPVVANHTYVSLAHEGEENNYVAFRVTSVSNASNQATIRYAYRTPWILQPMDFCERFPALCEQLLPCAKYPFLCEPVTLIPDKDGLRIRFRRETDRMIVPVERICQFVLHCPVCGSDGLCTEYKLRFSGMPDAFGIEIWNSKGVAVARDLGRARTKRAEFRTEPGLSYFLVIRPGEDTKTDVEYRLPIALDPR